MFRIYMSFHCSSMAAAAAATKEKSREFGESVESNEKQKIGMKNLTHCTQIGWNGVQVNTYDDHEPDYSGADPYTR